MVEVVSLVELLSRVPSAGNGDPSLFRVEPIPATPRHYVGRNAEGRPCMLLGSPADRLQAPIRLAAIEARFGVACRISPADGVAREEVLTVVTCTAPEPQVQAYFLHACETIVRIVGPNPSQHLVVEVVQRLVDLFQRVTRPSSRSVTGLVGELYVIALSRDAAAAVRAWRSADDDRFDFTLEDVRMEVKASGERTRAHYLSADQCQPPAGTVGLLASLFIESAGGGMSVQELVREIEGRLGSANDLLLKLQETVAESLGDGLPSAFQMRFDERSARASLQLYDLAVIPAIREGVPPEVTQVRFRSDLSRTPTLSAAAAGSRSPAAARIVPQP